MFKRRSASFALPFLAGASVMMYSSVAHANPATNTQALSIANNFLAKVNQQVSANGVSAINNQLANPDSLDTGTRWSFSYSDQKHISTIDVDKATGSVYRYFKQGVLDLSSAPNQATISQQDAISLATNVLTDAGALQSGELTFHEALLEQPDRNDKTWFVSWVRTYQGIPYHNENANVLINAETGETIGFSVNFKSLPPLTLQAHSIKLNNNDAAVSQLQAMKLATNTLTAHGLSSFNFVSSKQEIVQPNDYWIHPGGAAPTQENARIAWAVTFQKDLKQITVWIDADSGNTLGGEYCGLRGRLGAQSAAKSDRAKKSKDSALTHSPSPKTNSL